MTVQKLMLALSSIRAVQKDSYTNRVEDRRWAYWVEPELVNFLSSSNDSELRSHHFPKAGQGVSIRILQWQHGAIGPLSTS